MNAPSDKVYTFGYSPTATQMMAERTAKTHAAFLLPHLRAGMRVLDCGCGPGSITLGLAEVVAPGEVVGIDIEASQIELARVETAKRGSTNVRFDVADAYHLGFPDATFDAVFGHTILMQFRDPSPVLTELGRVLKPGGLVGFREPAFDGNLCEPPDGARKRYSTLFDRMLDHNGGDPRVGRRLGGLMHHMGLRRVTTSSSYEVAGTAEAKQLAYERTARICEEAGWLDRAIALGWFSAEERATLAAALRAEGATPEAFWALAFCEAIGWKDTRPSA